MIDPTDPKQQSDLYRLVLVARILNAHHAAGSPGFPLQRLGAAWDAPFLVETFHYEDWLAWHSAVLPLTQ